MQTTVYHRKPLTVEAIQVDADNLYEVAKWCGGDVHTHLTSGKKHIEVAVLHPLHKKQTRAAIGDWVLRSEQGFKIYADSAFRKGFEPAQGELENMGDVLRQQLAFKAPAMDTI